MVTLSKSDAQKYFESEEYQNSSEKSFNIRLKKPQATAGRGVKVTRVEFQDYIRGRNLDQCKYPYCRVFVYLSNGKVYEYKRDNRVTDPSDAPAIFRGILSLLQESTNFSRLGFTDIS